MTYHSSRHYINSGSVANLEISGCLHAASGCLIDLHKAQPVSGSFLGSFQGNKIVILDPISGKTLTISGSFSTNRHLVLPDTEGQLLTSAVVDSIELDLKLTSTLNRYKQFIYAGNGNLNQLKIWNNSGMGVLYYTVNFTYDGNNTVTNIQTIRNSDSFTYNKILSYDGDGNLSNISIT